MSLSGCHSAYSYAQLLYRDTSGLIEAGRIDGAGEWTLFRRVVIPLGFAAAASLAIFQFIWVWNDLLVALVYLGGNPHVPLTLFLYNQERALANNFWSPHGGGSSAAALVRSTDKGPSTTPEGVLHVG